MSFGKAGKAVCGWLFPSPLGLGTATFGVAGKARLAEVLFGWVRQAKHSMVSYGPAGKVRLVAFWCRGSGCGAAGSACNGTFCLGCVCYGWLGKA